MVIAFMPPGQECKHQRFPRLRRNALPVALTNSTATAAPLQLSHQYGISAPAARHQKLKRPNPFSGEQMVKVLRHDSCGEARECRDGIGGGDGLHRVKPAAQVVPAEGFTTG